jgi:hypothetical protein
MDYIWTTVKRSTDRKSNDRLLLLHQTGQPFPGFLNLEQVEKAAVLLCPAVRTPDPGKAALRIAAVEIALDDILDDRPEISIVPLEPALIFRDEPLKMMKKHPIENGAFRMTRAIYSRHGGRKASRNGPTSPMKPYLPEKKRKPGSNGQFWARERQQVLMLGLEYGTQS